MDETTVSPPGSAGSPGDRKQEKARRHERLENLFFVLDLVLTALILWIFQVSGASASLARWAEGVVGWRWAARGLYLAIATTAYMVGFILPYDFCTGYLLDRRFDLTPQSPAGWLADFGKRLVLNVIQMVVAMEVVYVCLDLAGSWWWFWAGLIWFGLGVLLTQLYPVLILPLFHKGEPLEPGPLRERLREMARSVGVRLVGVYRLRLSDKTRQANAAFAGLGSTRRILLGDTLLDRFPDEEIEVVMAHEMGHYRNRDLWRLLLVNGLVIFGSFLAADRLLHWVFARFPSLGITEIADIAGLPLFCLVLGGCLLLAMPLLNGYARRRERAADRFALEMTRNAAAFVRAMERLGRQNLAVFDPHPAVEWLLHSHPSLQRRIRAAREWAERKGIDIPAAEGACE